MNFRPTDADTPLRRFWLFTAAVLLVLIVLLCLLTATNLSCWEFSLG